jgi:hypothetical protein
MPGSDGELMANCRDRSVQRTGGCISLLSGENMGVLHLGEAFGAMAESTRDNVRWFPRFQPRCGLVLTCPSVL